MKIIILILLSVTAYGQEFADVTVHKIWKNRKDITPVHGQKYSWPLGDDTARYFHPTPGKRMRAVVTFIDADAPTIPTQPTTTETVVDDRNPLIKYNPAWSPFTGTVYQDGTAQYTATLNATATLQFTGNRIEYWAEKRMNHGIAGIKIDNEPEI